MRKKIKMQVDNNVTLQEGVQAYLNDLEARNCRAGTIRHYDIAVKQIYKIIPPDTSIAELDKDTWDSFKIEIRCDGRNEMSCYTYCRDFKTLLRFFMKQEWLPQMALTLPKVDSTAVETYTDEELKKLLKRPNMRSCNFTEYKCWVMVNFLMSTGMRQHSLVNIKIRDVDFDTHTVTARVTKNRKVLIIPLNHDIEMILKEYLKYRKAKDDEYLFCNEFGNQLVKSTIYHQMYWYNKNRGVETTGIHRYRHTFAKKWVMMGGNVVALQKILGHSSLAITQNYLNLLTSDVAKEMNEFNILRQFKSEAIKMNKSR